MILLLGKQPLRRQHPKCSEGIPLPRDPKLHDGESTIDELAEIHNGVDQDIPTKEEAEELTKEFGDEDESAA